MRKFTLLSLFIILCMLAHGQGVMLEDVQSFYPRLIRLAANGSANGRLIASFDVTAAGHIYQSTNGGVSWSQIATISETQYTNTCCGELYEVPQNLGSTTAGTLFWAVAVRNGQKPTSCAIKIYKSTDQGNTWSYFSTPVTGVYALWEPELAVDDYGRLVIYYASEDHKGAGYNQLLAHKVSTDGGATWGSEVFDVAISDGVQRPGMNTVKRLPNGNYVMVYEICSPTNNCDAFIRTSSDGVNWGTPSNVGTRIESVLGNHFSHAPTVNWIDNGTSNGVLVVTAQVLSNGSNQTVAGNGKIFMANTNNGTGQWSERVSPLYTPSNGTNACNHYSSQLVGRSGGSQVIQLSNIDCRVYSGIGSIDAPPIADGVYRFVAKHSGKVLDVNGCSASDGANVQQWPWVGGDCQRWKIEYLGNGEYKITSQVSGKALDVSGCSTSNGANIHQWPWNGANCQRWYIDSVGDGYYRLVSKHSGRVLDVNGCSTANGTNVHQWNWLGTDCQRWSIEPVSPNKVPDGYFRITSKKSGKVLDVSGCSSSPGANVHQWPWNGADCQRWTISATADGYYEITSNLNDLSLNVDGCVSSNGGNVETWTVNGQDCQRWGFEEVESGYYKITSKNGLRVLDVNGCSNANGANVQIWNWLGGDCQRWSLTSVAQHNARIATESSEILQTDSLAQFIMYPNPLQEEMAMTFSHGEIGEALITIINAAGQEVLRENVLVVKGNNQLKLDLNYLESGVYFLNISSSEFNRTEKIIKE